MVREIEIITIMTKDLNMMMLRKEPEMEIHIHMITVIIQGKAKETETGKKILEMEIKTGIEQIEEIEIIEEIHLEVKQEFLLEEATGQDKDKKGMTTQEEATKAIPDLIILMDMEDILEIRIMTIMIMGFTLMNALIVMDFTAEHVEQLFHPSIDLSGMKTRVPR